MWIPALKRLAKDLPADVDFCIAALPSRWDRTFATLHDFKSPTIVRQVIDLSGDWPDITKRFNKKKREIFNRLTKKNPYEFRISKELATTSIVGCISLTRKSNSVKRPRSTRMKR
jgi:hypothetical protein